MFVYLLVRRTEKIQSHPACSFVVGHIICGIVWNTDTFLKTSVFQFYHLKYYLEKHRNKLLLKWGEVLTAMLIRQRTILLREMLEAIT